MKRATLRWAAAAAGLFFLFLLLTLPARHVWGWFSGGQLAVQDMDGTLWSGRVARLVHPAFPVGPLVWRLRPQALLLGRLEYQVYVQSGKGGGELRAGIGPFAGRYVADAHLTLPAAELGQRLQLTFVNLSGDFQIDVDELRLSADGIAAVEGLIVWRDARVEQPSPMFLGHLQMQVGLREDQLVGKLNDGGDQGGPLELSGELRVGMDRRYQLDARLKPRANAEPPLRQALGLLGAPDTQGRYRLQYSGAL